MVTTEGAGNQTPKRCDTRGGSSVGTGGLGSTQGDRPGLAWPPLVVQSCRRAGFQGPLCSCRGPPAVPSPTPRPLLKRGDNKIHLAGWGCSSNELWRGISSEIPECPADGGCCSYVHSCPTRTPTTQAPPARGGGQLDQNGLFVITAHLALREQDE